MIVGRKLVPIVVWFNCLERIHFVQSQEWHPEFCLQSIIVIAFVKVRTWHAGGGGTHILLSHTVILCPYLFVLCVGPYSMQQ